MSVEDWSAFSWVRNWGQSSFGGHEDEGFLRLA